MFVWPTLSSASTPPLAPPAPSARCIPLRQIAVGPSLRVTQAPPTPHRTPPRPTAPNPSTPRPTAPNRTTPRNAPPHPNTPRRAGTRPPASQHRQRRLWTRGEWRGNERGAYLHHEGGISRRRLAAETRKNGGERRQGGRFGEGLGPRGSGAKGQLLDCFGPALRLCRTTSNC